MSKIAKITVERRHDLEYYIFTNIANKLTTCILSYLFYYISYLWGNMEVVALIKSQNYVNMYN